MKAVQKTLIFVLFVSTAVDGLSQAFVKRSASTLKPQSFDYGAWLRKIAQSETGAPLAVDYPAYLKNRQEALKGASSAKTSAISIATVGTSSNAYTILDNRTHQVFVHNPTKTLGWIHRQNIDEFGAGGQSEVVANGIHRFDYSVDEGKTFPEVTNNTGVGGLNFGTLNPLPFPPGIVARPRYPQGLVYNPTGQTGRENLKMPWISPSTDGNGWGNYVGGMTKNLTSISKGPTVQPSHPDANYKFVSNNHDLSTLIPGGISMGRNGEFFVADVGYKPTGAEQGQTLKYLQIWKGKASADHTDIDWTLHQKLEPGTVMTNNAGSYQMSNANLSFSPDGKWGWLCATAHVNLPDRPEQCESILMMYKSTDYGDSWKGPMYFWARDYSAIVDSITFVTINDAGQRDTSTQIPTVLDFDITVDANGNPHVFTNFANKADTKPLCHLDSLGYLQTGRFGLFDITTNNHGETWCPKFVATSVAFQGTISGTQLSFNNYLQSSRSEDGTRIFFSWADDTATTSANQMNPDVWDRALRITDDAMTPLRSVSLGDAVFGKAIYFPTISPVMYELGGGKYRMPTVFLKIVGSETTPCEYYMINDRDFDDANFVVPKNDLEVTVLEPVGNQCGVSSVQVKISVKNVGAVPVGPEGVVVAYMVNGGTAVKDTITDAANLAPGATKEFTFDAPAAIPNSGTYIFDVMAMLPFDQHCENSNIRSSVANFGGVQKNLITQTQLAGCGAVTVTTGLPGLATIWSKDGAEIAEFNGKETVTVDASILGGLNGDLVVSVTNPDCPGGEMIKDTVEININPPPTTNAFAADTQICKTNAPLLLSASPNDTYTYAWYKRNDNGTFPANPSVTTNQISIPSTGYYRVKVTDPNTSCEITRETYAIIWDIKLTPNLGLTGTEPFAVCGGARTGPTSLNASNSNIPDNYGVTYDWYLTGKGYNGDPETSLPKNYDFSDTLIQSGTSPIFKTLYDVVPKPVKYRVVVKDPLGCVPNGISETVDVAVYDSIVPGWKITFTRDTSDVDNDYVNDITNAEPASVCCNRWIRFENMAKPTAARGNSPVTAVLWDNSSAIAASNIFIQGASNTPQGEEEKEGTAISTTGVQTKRGVDVIKYKVKCDAAGKLTFKLKTNSGPCTKTLTKVINVVKGDSCKPIGIDEKLKAFAELNVYPNPSGGAFNLNVKAREIGPLTVTVFDLTGKMITVERQNNVRDYKTTLDLSDKPAGIYLLKVETAQGYYTERLIKE